MGGTNFPPAHPRTLRPDLPASFTMSTPIQRYVAELRRRKVPHVAGVYVAAAFAVMQAADLILPRPGLPEWTVTLVIITLVLGFPLAIALAWAFEVRSDSGGPDESVVPAVATSPRNVALWVATFGLILVLGGGSYAWLHRVNPLAAEAAPFVRGRVLVMPFKNRTGDASLDPFGSMAAQWIAEGIAQSGVADVVADPAITEQARAGGARDVSAAGIAVRAGLVVSGSLFLAGDSLRIVAEVTDLTEGTRSTLAGVAGERTSTAVLLATRDRVLGAVATKLDMATRNLTTAEVKPPLYEAFRAWSEGIELFTNRNWADAAAAFSRAAQLDTSFVTPLLWEIAAYGNQIQREAADSLIRLLLPRRERLLPTDRAQLDYWVETLRGNNAGRYSAAERMLAASPGSELATYLAGIQAYRMNLAAEAVELLTRIRPPRGQVDWDAYGLQLTEAYHLLGDHDAELQEARRARTARPDLTLHMRDEARALAALGRDAS
jgi:TolB-like protein